MTFENKILVSFVIPIYNVEAYLPECIENIIHNKSDSFEVILVDDGSPDNCPQICDDYKSKDSRIVVVHQSNAGPSAARNRGIKEATGKYIAFIDGDDRICSASINEILSWADTSDDDICFMQAIKFYPNGKVMDLGDRICQKGLKEKSKIDSIDYLTKRPKFPGSACTKLFNRRFLIENNLFFPEDRCKSEDLFFILRCVCIAETFNALDCRYYEYRQNREGSITNGLLGDYFSAYHMFITDSCALLLTNNEPKGKVEKYLMSFVAYDFAMLMFANIRDHHSDEKFVRDYSWVLRYGRETKLKGIYLLVRLFGLTFTSNLIGIVKKIV